MKVGRYSFIADEIQGHVMTIKEWNDTGKRWSTKTLAIQRNKARHFTKGKGSEGQPSNPHTYKAGRKAGQTEHKLAQEGESGYSFKMRFEKGEYAGTEFKPPVHGIFREWGVGNGQPRRPGKKTAKKIHKKRTQSDWITYTIERNGEELAQFAAEYVGDQVLVNAFGIKMRKLQ